MSLATELRNERQNAAILIDTYTSRVSSQRRRKEYEATMLAMSTLLRTRAVAQYVIDADIDAFRLDLIRSARCQLFYYCHIQMGMTYSRSIGAITNDEPFFDALAAGSERDAMLLTYYQIMAPQENDLVSERYPYNMFLRSKVLDKVRHRPSYTSADVEQWLEPGGGAGVIHQIARSMQAGDSKGFRDAMKAFLTETRQRFETSDVSTKDQLLSIEGLGLCWLASTKCGIKVDIDDPLTPRELQERTDPLAVPRDVPILTDAELAEMEQQMADRYHISINELRARRPDPRV